MPKDHPLRAIRKIADAVFVQLSPQFDKRYARMGRPSIAPEKLLRGLLLQVLYSVRSERLLLEELDYNMLFHWFIGLNMDDREGTTPRQPVGGPACNLLAASWAELPPAP